MQYPTARIVFITALIGAYLAQAATAQPISVQRF